MKTSPQTTICIPTYNCEPYVLETYESIKSQNYPTLKIKFFDNHSTDKTLEIITKIKSENPAVEVHSSDRNIGGENNFNRCIAAGDGEYMALFHADDVYFPDIISTAIDNMEKDPEIVAVTSHAILIDQNGKAIGERFIPPEIKSQDFSLLDQKQLLHLVFKYGNFITCPSVVARTSIFKDHIKRWDGEDFKSSADLDVWLRMAEMGKILFVNQAMMAYRESAASFSFNLFRSRIKRHDLFLVLDKYKDHPLLKDDSDIQRFYNFLKFKDISLRSYNILRTKNPIAYPPYSMPMADVFRCLFISKFHFKFGVLGLGVLVIRQLSPLWLRKFFFKGSGKS